MKLIKKADPTGAPASTAELKGTMDRRTFLKRSGMTVGGIAATGALPLGMMRKA